MRASDFDLFGSLKKYVAGKWYAIADVKQAVELWLQTNDANFSYAGIEALVPWCDQCLNLNV
jgi:hypothetical protein